MTDRALIEVARGAMTAAEFSVWFAKHYQGRGRRSGSLTLGISEEAWRYRLTAATRKLDAVIAATKDAA